MVIDARRETSAAAARSQDRVHPVKSRTSTWFGTGSSRRQTVRELARLGIRGRPRDKQAEDPPLERRRRFAARRTTRSAPRSRASRCRYTQARTAARRR